MLQMRDSQEPGGGTRMPDLPAPEEAGILRADAQGEEVDKKWETGT